MRSALLLTATCLALAACSAPDNSQQATTETASAPSPASAKSPFSISNLAAFDRYESTAREFAQAIDDDAPTDELAAYSEELVEIAAGIVPEFVAARPDCSEYLDATLKLRDIWTNLSAEEIETGYHKDQALPKITNGAACYHMKDLVVHPITAQALLLEDAIGNRDRARREIDEVVAHVSVVKALR